MNDGHHTSAKDGLDFSRPFNIVEEEPSDSRLSPKQQRATIEELETPDDLNMAAFSLNQNEKNNQANAYIPPAPNPRKAMHFSLGRHVLGRHTAHEQTDMPIANSYPEGISYVNGLPTPDNLRPGQNPLDLVPKTELEPEIKTEAESPAEPNDRKPSDSTLNSDLFENTEFSPSDVVIQGESLRSKGQKSVEHLNRELGNGKSPADYYEAARNLTNLALKNSYNRTLFVDPEEAKK